MDKELVYFVIADTPAHVQMLRKWLELEDASIQVFDCALCALGKKNLTSCDAVLFLLDKAHEPAIAIIKKIKHLAPLLPIIAVVKKGNIRAAVELVKATVDEVIENSGDWQKIAKYFIAAVTKKPSQYPLSLTVAEKKILPLLCSGHTNRAIAEKLNRHERTIEAHRAMLFSKFEVSSSMHLTKKALEANLLTT